ncbi:MAG: DUF3131 domain-containing protein [Firmicutes bacterium]|nr:DUF3131 domain-containing protein [Bacillota bacterium]
MYNKLKQFKQDLKVIEKYYHSLVKLTKEHQIIGAFNEWILDNYASLLEHKNMVLEYYGDKNLMKSSKTSGETIWNILTYQLEETRYKMSKKDLIRYFNNYQKKNKTSFTYQNILLIRPLLSMVAIHKVKTLCDQEKYILQERNRAEKDIKFLESKIKKKQDIEIEQYISIKEDIIEYPIYLKNLNENLHRLDKYGSRIFYEINENLEKNNTNLKKVLQEVYKDSIENNLIISNLFQVLKLNENLKIETLYEEISETEKELLKDKVYQEMDTDTKDSYRRSLVKLAKKNKINELTCARRIISKSEKEKKHIGFFLYKNPNLKIREILYITSIVLFTLIICYFLSPFLVDSRVLGILILFIPTSEIVMQIINRILTYIYRPKALPKMDLSKGLTEDVATIVVIPTIVKDTKKIDEMFANLESYYLANKTKHLYFSLLGDCSEQKEQEIKLDKELAEYGKNKIEELNQKYKDNIFHFVYRKRVWHDSEDSYLGWERKRGALIHFNRLLLNKFTPKDKEKYFHIETLSTIQEKIKYVITLDADTKLVVNSVNDLVGTMYHPLNRPILNKERNKVISGYGIIQPKISIDVESSNKSIYAELFAGLGGFDVYNTLVSNFYQDVFHEGSFMGKGIYDLKVFDEVLDGRFPEQLILSHDLVESNLLRSGYTSNIELFDDFCSRYLTDMTRHHRWMRGDVQVTPWLLPKVKDEKNNTYKNPMNLIEKWKIFDNIRRSLIEVCLLIILLFAYLNKNIEISFWVGYVLLIIAIPLIFYLTEKLRHQFTKKIKVKPYSNIIKSGEAVIIRTAISFTTIPYKANLYLNAMIKSFYRMIISKKKLLNWLTAEEAEKTVKNTLSNYIVNFKPNYITIVFLLVLTYIFHKENFVSAMCISLSFALAPYITYYISKESRINRFTLGEEERKEFLKLAEKTWDFFESNFDEETNYLIPDNYQENREQKKDSKTSPTDIGFQLTSIISAYELGFISSNKAVSYLEKVITTVEKLDKWNGHLYNWYNINNLKVLFPHFVSSVDSGNFVACLIVVKEFLNRLNENNLKPRVEKLINDSDFSKLYTDDEVFSVGYNDFENELSVYKYNRFASESRLMSYVAIAKGDVSSKHWFCLDKTLTKFQYHKGLASWAGSLFEYYMPLIFMKSYPNTLLDESYDFSYYCQRHYMREQNKDLPWGISECAYDELDNGVNYKYKTFSIPYLKLQENTDERIVISPYSSMMVVTEKPKEVYQNYQKMKKINLEGKYGLYESFDTETTRPVYAYFSHHQGMILASLTNYLTNGIIQDLFMNDKNNQAFEILTKEKIQLNPVIDWKIAKYKRFNYQKETIENDMRYFTYPSDLPEVSAISNSKYTVLMNDRGNGFSRYKDIQLNRYRKVTEQDYGTFLYIKDLKTKKYWTNTYAPLNKKPEKYEVVFASDRIKYVLVEDKIATTTEIVVSNNYQAEIRKITVKNNDKVDRKLEFTTYLEPTIIENASDVTHRTFNSLFLESEFDEETKSLIMKKNLRNSDTNYYLLHKLHIPGCDTPYQYETRRVDFVGRNNTPRNPLAMENDKLTNQVGTPIDPVMSMRNTITISKEKSVEFYIINCFGTSKNQVLEAANYYKNKTKVEEAFELATITNINTMKKLNITGADMRLYNIMLNYLYQTSKINLNEDRKKLLKENKLSQENLWKFGISGDRPMITLTLHDISSLSLAKQVLKAYEYFKNKGIYVDIIILNEEAKTYEKNIKKEIDFLIYQIQKTNSFQGKPGNIYYIEKEEMTKEEEILLNTVARLRLDSREHLSLKSFIESLQKQNSASDYKTIKKQQTIEIDYDTSKLDCFNGYGGFSENGKEYIITNPNTPTPWTNILVNKTFGSLVTNNAAGFTFANNSQDFKLTSWTNDLVSFDQSEGIRIDGESFVPLITKHGFGYTTFLSETKEYKEQLTEFVAEEDQTKFYQFSITNKEEEKDIIITFWMNPVLGSIEEKTSRYILSEANKKENYLMMRNAYQKDYRNQYVFLTSTEKIDSMSTDKILVKSIDIKLHLKKNETKQLGFILGCANQETDISKLKEKYSTIEKINQELNAVKTNWQTTLEKVQIKTPDKKFDNMVNGWYLYQTLAGRIMARAGFYQVSGAFGYRDQLQDTTNICFIYPELTKEQIIKNAKHQFREGDVLHWWLNPKNFGLRSRFKDDYLWLVYATSEYLKYTNDTDILNEQIPFVEGEALKEHEEEKGVTFYYSNDTKSLYEHCYLSIERTLNDLGTHGLPKMGGGDWNDGMNKIGIKGEGESVWLGFFFYDLLERFIEITKIYNPSLSTKKYEDARVILKDNLNKNAWNGEYYLRAFFDNQKPVGAKENQECKIDLISQSFSILSEAVLDERVENVLSSVEKYLVDKNSNIVKLLTPPFKNSKDYPGYIMDYPKGIRENGGQYTHSVAWYIMALIKANRIDEAYNIYQMINPANRTLKEKDVETYCVEPYVIAADIYSNPNHEGRGGWTWYTGSSGWFYRVGIENICGLTVKGNKLYINPNVPSSWKEFEITFKYHRTLYEIKVYCHSDNRIKFDGKEVNEITLNDDNQTHRIEIGVK